MRRDVGRHRLFEETHLEQTLEQGGEEDEARLQSVQIALKRRKKLEETHFKAARGLASLEALHLRRLRPPECYQGLPRAAFQAAYGGKALQM